MDALTPVYISPHRASVICRQFFQGRTDAQPLISALSVLAVRWKRANRGGHSHRGLHTPGKKGKDDS